ncbi:MAG: ATP-dependent DNA helicase RecG [Brockia lithotrophica]|nr:ATP-dependent DNA helicase RecG [Brockia lithotrophica]
MPSGERRDEGADNLRVGGGVAVGLFSAPLPEVVSLPKSRQDVLAAAGIRTVGDALLFVPRRYEDFRAKPLEEVRVPETLSVVGVVQAHPKFSRFRGNFSRLATSLDVGGRTITVVWFNQPYLRERLIPGARVQVAGRYDPKSRQLVAQKTRFSAEGLATDSLTPVYGLPGRGADAWFSELVRLLFSLPDLEIPDPLPAALREKYRLLPRGEALRTLHFPSDERELFWAKRRMAFEEVFLYQLKVLAARNVRVRTRRTREHRFRPEEVLELTSRWPFPLTGAQRRAVQEIFADLLGPHPMNRLLQGDVGSGKTAVATLAIYAVVRGGRQAALMAPTEILAEQHVRTLRSLLPEDVPIALLTGRTPRREREEILFGLAQGSIPVAVGTHALITEHVRFADLGFIVVDEQHRFGVVQRRLLAQKGDVPDLLSMSATPIPRTLALLLYGDLDVSVLDEMPPGRTPVETHWTTPERFADVLTFVDGQIERGRQAYVIAPLIEASDKLDYQNVVDLYDQVRNFLPGRRVGLLHGRLSGREKDRVMRAFVAGELDVLVSTTVVEVGVDVPNATVMVIYDADRFGLAQLHQLRGRVGRGAHKSYCILVADPRTEIGRKRLRVFRELTDGFQIAEKDFELRGPGDLFGTKQSGLPEFRFTQLDSPRELRMLRIAHEEAERLLADSAFWETEEAIPLREALASVHEETGQLWD